MRKHIFFILLPLLLAALGLGVYYSFSNTNVLPEWIPGFSSVFHGRELKEIASDIPGSAYFKTDKDRSIEKEYTDNGEELILSVMDGGGRIWELYIPPHAVIGNKTIRMTPLSDIRNDKLGEINSGVLLEPDGLQFLVPATLSVSGGEIEKNGILLTGAHDGSHLNFAINEKEGGILSAHIFHFSSAYADDLDSIFNAVTHKQIRQSYYNVVEEVIKFLKEPLNIPEPPSIPVGCPGESSADGEGALKESYLKAFIAPEVQLLERLLAQRKAYEAEMAGSDKEGLPEDWQWEGRLVERLRKKSSKLIRMYYPGEEKFKASAYAVVGAEKIAQIVAGRSGTAEDSVTQQLSDWAHKVSEKYLNRLIEKHDYKAISPTIEFRKLAELSGSLSEDGYYERLDKALHFKVEYKVNMLFHVRDTLSLDIDDLSNEVSTFFLYGGRKEEYNISTEGKAELDMLWGRDIKSGKGAYTGFKPPTSHGTDRISINMPNQYEFNAVILQFAPCNSDEILIAIDKFGAEREELRIDWLSERGPKTTVRKPKQWVQRTFEALFNDKKVDAGIGHYYRFPLKIKNGSEIAAEGTFEATNGEGHKIELIVKVIHDPI